MEEKIEKIKESDLYFLKNLQDAIQSLDTLDQIIETDGKRQSDKDMEISDYLHILEELDNDSSDEIFAKVGRKISIARKERRHLKNEYLLINEYQQIKAKLSSKENRQFITSSMHKRMKELNQPYNFRILSEEEIKLLTQVQNTVKGDMQKPKKERKRNPESIELDEQIWEMYKQGISQKEIAKRMNTTQPTICIRLKRIKEEKQNDV